jgi:hypothetical protein
VATAVSPLGRLLRFVRVAVASVMETRYGGVVVLLMKPTLLLTTSRRSTRNCRPGSWAWSAAVVRAAFCLLEAAGLWM